MSDAVLATCALAAFHGRSAGVQCFLWVPASSGGHPLRGQGSPGHQPQRGGLAGGAGSPSPWPPLRPRRFPQSIVSKNATQYRGSSQHDAQEFLLWLLDRVHEDLHNSMKNNGRPLLKPPLEEDVLLDGSAFSINSTFVQELFQAQYRSSLTCPHCQKQSNTFDPFLCISLPIPLPHTRPLYVTVVYRGKCSHCMRIGVAVPLSGTVARLREAVARETKIPTKQ
ncbi:Ubiquitin carboxyl-terminal hydrolase 31, partial [Varanus komodoensis]